MSVISLVLVAGVFYFSWLPQPKLGDQVAMPGMLGSWLDAPANENIRTAVPFLLLGLAAGAGLWTRDVPVSSCLFRGLLLVGVACAAELGQCLIPARTCDLGDIGWAAAGVAAGLGIIRAGWRLKWLAGIRRGTIAEPAA